MAVCFVYIVSNRSHRLYIGMTGDPHERAREHRKKTYVNAFTARYKFDRLVYYEPHPSYEAALKREKQMKNWPRAKKVALIQQANPKWLDLARSWDQRLRETLT